MKKDVAIIGAGPVGMFASFYGAMRGLDVVLIDKLEKVGGQLSALYPEKYIYDVAGFDKVKAKDLIENLEKQIAPFEDKIEYKLKEEVLEINKRAEQDFLIKTTTEEIEVSSVIIAGGNGGFEARKLGVDNEEEFDIDYFIDKPEKYKGLDVAIFGGGDSAVDFSLMLEGIANSINIIHRRDAFRAHEASVDKLNASSVEVNTPYSPKKIEKQDNKYLVTIASKEEEKNILVDKIICNFGFISKLGAIENFGLNIENNKIVVDSAHKTNIDGIFAIGDICTFDGKLNLIISGFGEGPVAIGQVAKYINPDEEVGFAHSSSLFETK